MTTSKEKSTPEGKREWSGKTHGGNWGLEFLISLLGKLSLRGSYALLDIALPFYLPFNPKGFRVTRNYFESRMGLTRREARRKAYATHRLFGQQMFDRFRFFSRGSGDFKVQVVGEDGILERMSGGSGFVVAGSHVGNMELAGYVMGIKDKPINAVVYGGEAASLQGHRSEILRQHGVRMIPVLPDLSHLFEIKAALDREEIVSMPCDRLFGSRKYIECKFLGAPATFPIGAFVLAAQTGKDVVALFNMKEGCDGYKVYARPLRVDREALSAREIAESLAKRYVAELEDMVRKYPEQWFNFYDFWKNE